MVLLVNRARIRLATHAHVYQALKVKIAKSVGLYINKTKWSLLSPHFDKFRIFSKTFKIIIIIFEKWRKKWLLFYFCVFNYIFTWLLIEFQYQIHAIKMHAKIIQHVLQTALHIHVHVPITISEAIAKYVSIYMH